MNMECLIVCGDRNLGVGLTVWDIESGQQNLHIPTSASPPYGVICLRNMYLVASQIHRPGCVGDGVIFTWPLNKTQSPLRHYTAEIIGPICCTKDGVYLAGGAPSGNIYIWEVTSGALLKRWSAHTVPITCMAFSHDGSLFISASQDGMIVVWSMISLLDAMGDQSWSSAVLSCSTAHTSSVTGLLATSSGLSSVFVSSSLDGTCKVWDVFSQTLLQTRTFPIPITAIALDPAERHLFSGSGDGRIFVNTCEVGLSADPYCNPDDQQMILKKHTEAITALTFCRLGLISASEDCTACLWNVVTWEIIRIFEHPKGAISNLVVVPRSSMIPLKSHQRATYSFRFSLLHKQSQTSIASSGMATLLPSQKDESVEEYCSTNVLNQQLIELQGEHTSDALKMKVDTNIDNRAWISTMTKRTMTMNKQLQIKILDLAENRQKEPASFSLPDSPREGPRKKKIKETNLPLEDKGKAQPQG